MPPSSTFDLDAQLTFFRDEADLLHHFTYNDASKPSTIEANGVGTIHVTYNDDGEINDVQSDSGRDVTLKVTAPFQKLLEVIPPAGLNVSF